MGGEGDRRGGGTEGKEEWEGRGIGEVGERKGRRNGRGGGRRGGGTEGKEGWEWRGMDLIKVHTYRELYQT